MALTKNEGNNPLTNNHFLLRVEALFDLPCYKIGAFRDEKEFETIQAGGINNYVYLREKPTSKMKTFTIDRYVDSKYFDPLIVGFQPTMPIILYISRYANNFKDVKATFYFTGCTVLSKNYGDMSSERSGLFSISTTITYQQVYCSISDDDPKPEWQFDKSGSNFEGEGKRHGNYNRNELRKSAMLKLAKKWPEVSNAHTIKGPTPAELAAKARKWPAQRSARYYNPVNTDKT